MILGGLGGIVVSSLYPSQLEAAVQEEAEEVASEDDWLEGADDSLTVTDDPGDVLGQDEM